MSLKNKILVVDDEEVMLELLNDYFSMIGFKVDTALNGKIAYDLFIKNDGSNCYDLVVTDINMPIMGGVDLQKNIKKDFPNFPVLFMTGFGLEKIKNQIDIESIDGLIAKPFELDNMIQVISKILDTDLNI